MTAVSRETTRGVEMFARYAHAPNALGFCGPASGLGTGDGEVRAAAKRFSGAWPYLQVLARLTGTADPLDERLVEAYWLGRELGIARTAFGAELLAVIGPQAGHYWTHLTPELLATGSPDHGFHVFGVYPWSRLLGSGMDEQALRVLDSCRIRWGLVISCDGAGIEVSTRHLTWDGTVLGLGDPAIERIADPRAGVEVGERVALHWDRFCDLLTDDQVATLEASTLRELESTNRRMAREGTA
ncbi:DUF6390 family protein [Pseudonocardia sp. GCM10023141]|uniref:DUF6390 family protein n=1 Tax=Pseudonocardia sp. GCM10023141 TaxID=3252653 RepID=UPI00360E3DFA